MAEEQAVMINDCFALELDGGYYPINVEIHETDNGQSYTARVEGGVPVWGHGPSQGEMDGIYSIHFNAQVKTAFDAVKAFKQSVEDARCRYGDPKLPDPMTVEEAERWYDEARKAHQS